MKTISLLNDVTFQEARPYAEPLLIDESGRVLRFTLKPGQAISRHAAPSSPVHITVLRGSGLFSGEDGQEQALAVGDMVVFDAGEQHAVRALEEELVFVAVLHRVPEQVLHPQASSPNEDDYLTWHM